MSGDQKVKPFQCCDRLEMSESDPALKGIKIIMAVDPVTVTKVFKSNGAKRHK